MIVQILANSYLERSRLRAEIKEKKLIAASLTEFPADYLGASNLTYTFLLFSTFQIFPENQIFSTR